MRNTACWVAVAVLVGASGTAAQEPGEKVDKEKIETVAVAGCLKESTPGTWSLVNASDPVVSTANAPSPKELASLPKGGTNEFRLIGVAVFNLPVHRGHSVIIKGLPIKATPARLNVTSVTMVAETCPPLLPGR